MYSNLEKLHIQEYILLLLLLMMMMMMMWAKDANQDLWCAGVCGGDPGSRKHAPRAPPSGPSHLLTIVTK